MVCRGRRRPRSSAAAVLLACSSVCPAAPTADAFGSRPPTVVAKVPTLKISASATLRQCPLPLSSQRLVRSLFDDCCGLVNVGALDFGLGSRGGRRAAPRGGCSSYAASASRLHLLKGLVSSVDDDIQTEEANARQSPVVVLISSLRAVLGAPTLGDKLVTLKEEMAKFAERTKASTGDTENKLQLLKGMRNYANEGLLEKGILPPVLDDLNQPDPSFATAYWVSPPFRMTVVFGSFLFFPILTDFLRSVIDVSPDEYDIINGQFGPGVGVLYGTFTALTLEILYQRQCNIQENSTLEASLLAQVTQNLLSLFRDDQAVAREASQIVADQVRVISSRSRGAEMLTIMRADPYARILSMVDRFHKSSEDFSLQEEALIECLRGEIPQLMESRAKRLSDEASELPPTHFLVLALLTGLSLIGFTTATLTIVGDDGKTPLESRLVFAGLTAIFFLFYNFCRDLNNPFGGVYQIKRSSAASYLLQTKWLIENQSFGKEVRFGSSGYRQTADGPDFACEDDCVIECEDADEFCAPPIPAGFSTGAAVSSPSSDAVNASVVVDNTEDLGDVEVMCIEDQCSIDDDEVFLLDDWDDGYEEEISDWEFYDDYGEYDSDVYGGAEATDVYVGERKTGDRLSANGKTMEIGTESAATVMAAAVTATSVAVVDEEASVETLTNTPAMTTSLPAGVDPAVLYFLGTSGFRPTSFSADSKSEAVRESDALRGSTEVLRAEELRRRKILVERRMRFEEDWHREALGKREVEARHAVAEEKLLRENNSVVQFVDSVDVDSVEDFVGHIPEKKARAGATETVEEKRASAAEAGEEEGTKYNAPLEKAQTKGTVNVETAAAEAQAEGKAEEKTAVEEAEAKKLAEEKANKEAEADANRIAKEKAAMEKAETEKIAKEESRKAAEVETETRRAAEEAELAAREAEQREQKEEQRRLAARAAFGSSLQPLKDPATGIYFSPKLGQDLYLLGVGVRRKAILNIYSVAAYSSYEARTSVSKLSARVDKEEALKRLRSAVRSAAQTTFVLEMTFKASAETMAGAIADSVAPRHSGDRSDIDKLKRIILEGVKKVKKGGAATKGTTFSFACACDGLGVFVDSELVGTVPSNDLSSSFCDVFFDDKAVSPALRENCVKNCCDG